MTTLTPRFALTIPQSGSDTTHTITCGQSVVFIGANGSGKTRLGSWVEKKTAADIVQRISAQKSLSMPPSSTTSSVGDAELILRYGNSNRSQLTLGYASIRDSYRWRSNPCTSLLDDFPLLMNVLFSEESAVSISHRQEQKINDQRIPVPQTRLDVIQKIWRIVLPHRELSIGSLKIEAYINGAEHSVYNGAEMSDGERVIFYLIGQALCAPPNGIIIIDEPELHLHKSIQTKLWLEIQAARPDCLFVYMTHDVEFAASLTEAKKIWLKSYNGQVWEWEEVPNVEGFPEGLLLQILGTRQPILFVEGDEGSYDVALFRVLYPNHAVFPRKGCEQVILATRALREAKDRIHVNARGIIDRDRRHPDEIPKLNANGVDVLGVAEVENLFCVPEVLRMVAKQLGFPVEEKLAEVENFVFNKLKKELEQQISLHVAQEIKFRLNFFDTKKQGVSALQGELQALASAIDVNALYAAKKAEFESVLTHRHYVGVLNIFNNKGVISDLSRLFGGTQIPKLVIRLANSGRQEELRQALSPYIPAI